VTETGELRLERVDALPLLLELPLALLLDLVHVVFELPPLVLHIIALLPERRQLSLDDVERLVHLPRARLGALDGLLEGEDLLLRAVLRRGVLLGRAFEDVDLGPQRRVGLLRVAPGGFERDDEGLAFLREQCERVLELLVSLLERERGGGYRAWDGVFERGGGVVG
jgi:hypothetical protein